VRRHVSRHQAAEWRGAQKSHGIEGHDASAHFVVDDRLDDRVRCRHLDHHPSANDRQKQE
jgi:hypothetical protein